MIRDLWILEKFRIRRDYVQLALWTIVTGLLALFSAVELGQSFHTARDREAIVRFSATNPTLLVVRGIPRGTSLDALTFFQIFVYLAILAALMSGFLAVRHSRGEEESGRADMIGATPAGRHLPTIATIVHGVIANAVLAGVVAGVLIAAGLNSWGSIVTGLAVGAVGLTFIGIGLLASQVTRSARGARGVTLAILGIAFILRAAGDADGTVSSDQLSVDSAWPSWLSFIGWGQQTHAYTDNTLAPLGLNVATFALAVTLVFVLQSVRDTGASLTPARRGRAFAHITLTGTGGLTWRLQWPTILSWCIAGAVFGLFAPTLAPVLSQSVGTNAAFTQAVHSIVPSLATGSIEQLFISIVFQIVGVLAAMCAIQVILHMRQEETRNIAEELLATPLSRVRWIAGYITTATISVALVLASGALASSVGFAVGGENHWGDSFVAGIAQAPAALVYLSVTAALFVALPTLAIGIAWGIIAIGAFFSIYGGLVGLPDWVRNLSPFTHSPIPLADSTDWSGAWVMLLIAVVVAVIAVSLMRAREIGSNVGLFALAFFGSKPAPLHRAEKT